VPNLPNQVAKAHDIKGHQDGIGLGVDQEDVTDLDHEIADHQEEDQDPAVDQEIVEDDPEAAKKEEDLEVDHDQKKDHEVDRLLSAEKKKKVVVDLGDEATDPDQTVAAHDLRKNFCTRTILNYWNLCIQAKICVDPICLDFFVRAASFPR